MRNSIFNFAGFQLGWFACVLGAANGMPWLGPVLAVPILGWHLSQASAPTAEFKLILTAAVGGSLFDQSLLSLGWIQYPQGSWPVWLLPLWMTTLWALFSSTLNVSLRWMRGRTTLAIVFGAIGGPLAYLAGEKLGAMQLVAQPHALLALACGWAVAMFWLLRFARLHDGYAKKDFDESRQHV